MLYVKYFFLVIIAICLLLASPIQAGIFGPKNYDECILKHMKGVTSDLAARAICDSCLKQFPKKKSWEVKSLSDEQIKKLSIGQAAFSNNQNRFTGDLYNGNTDINICDITVNLTTTINGKKVQRAYVGDFYTPFPGPLETRRFGFDIIAGDPYAKYSWEIIEAKSCMSE